MALLCGLWLWLKSNKLQVSYSICILISRCQLFLGWWLWLLQPLNKFFELLYEAFFGKTYGIAVQDVYASSSQQIVAELKFDLSWGVFCVGRASRYGSKFPEGAVTCLDKEDLPLFHHSLATLTCPLRWQTKPVWGPSHTTKDWLCCLNISPWLKKVGVESKISHGLGWSFLNLLWRKKWHI